MDYGRITSEVDRDQGCLPELVAQAVRQYLKEQNVETRYIEPGAPRQNACVESFNSKLRDELLDRELFTRTLEAQVLDDQFRDYYNPDRPGYRQKEGPSLYDVRGPPGGALPGRD